MILSLVAAMIYLFGRRVPLPDSVLPRGVHVLDNSNENVGVSARKAVIARVIDNLIPRDRACAHTNLAHGSKLAERTVKRFFVRGEGRAFAKDFACHVALRAIIARRRFKVGKVIALLNLKEQAPD